MQTKYNSEIFKKKIIILGGGIASLIIAYFLSKNKINSIKIYESGQKNKLKNQDLNKEYRKTSINKKNYKINTEVHYCDTLGWQKNLDRLRFRQLGGSANYWGSESQYFDKKELKVNRNNFGSWPIKFQEINNYYSIISKLFSFKNKFLKRKNYGKNFSEIFWSRNINPQFLKNKILHLLEKKSNINIEFDSTCVELKFSNKKCKSIFLNKKNKIIKIVKFDMLVIACGAIETTRLLLSSKSLKKNMIKKNYKNLGKFYSDHPHGFIGYINNPSEEFKKKFIKKNINKNSVSYLGLKNYLDNHTLSIAFQFHYELRDMLLRSHLRGIFISFLSLNFKSLFKEIFVIFYKIISLDFIKNKNRIKLWAVAEQDQVPKSYIKIFKERDRLGMQRININWQMTNNLKKNFKKTLTKLQDYFKEKRYGDIVYDTNLDLSSKLQGLHGGAHHFGTTRMSTNENYRFVDKNLKILNIRNTYVLSTSVFPTNGSANSTITLAALAARLADYTNSKIK
jgi:hypothetical protein